MLVQRLGYLSLVDEPQEGVGSIGQDGPDPPESTENVIGIVDILDEVDALGSFVPLFAASDQLLQQRLNHPSQESHALHQPVLGGVPDQGILVVEEVQHAEKTHLVELHKLLVNVKKVFVLVACQPPEMGEPLNGGLLVRRTMRIEGPLDGLSELEGKILAEADNKVNNLRMHMGIVQQRP